ncbi:MAG: pilin [Candidatus Saccharimonadales bacterium]
MIQFFTQLTRFADAATPIPGDCTPAKAKGIGTFLNFPHWYQYLHGVNNINGNSNCIPQIRALSDVWLIVAAIVEMLLRVAALAAIGFVLYGGVQYIMSQGEPDKTAKAKDTLFNALIGLAIAVTATVMVAFLAGQF